MRQYTREQIEYWADRLSLDGYKTAEAIMRQLLAELDAPAAKKRDKKRAERQAKAKEKLDALKRKAASSCFCYVVE